MQSFTEYVPARMAALLRFASVVTGDPDQADDIVQDVLIKAFRRWDHIGQLERPEAYLRRMVVNAHISWWRRRVHVRPARIELADVPVADPADQFALRTELVAAVRGLPRKQRAAVALRYYADHTDVEIAEILGCSPSTVRSQIARALVKLRVEVDDPASSTPRQGVSDAHA